MTYTAAQVVQILEAADGDYNDELEAQVATRAVAVGDHLAALNLRLTDADGQASDFRITIQKIKKGALS